MRLFIALELKDEVKKRISNIQANLKKEGLKGNFSRYENLHITLAFIGECDKFQMKEIVDSMSKIEFEPLDLVFSGFNFFGDVLYLDVEKSQDFFKLSEIVRKGLDEKNIDYDKKQARAHVTILRRAYVPKGINLKEYGKNIHIESKDVNSVVLYESERINGILTYTKKYEKRAKNNG